MSTAPVIGGESPQLALEFRAATVADADAIAGLVNKAYRPAGAERGWTHEADLVAGVCRIGMLATEPKWQNLGLGKRMLEQAEQFAVDAWSARRLLMSVLSSRPELLAFHECRGYARTGERTAYPAGAGVGTPKREDIHVLHLEKPAI